MSREYHDTAPPPPGRLPRPDRRRGILSFFDTSGARAPLLLIGGLVSLAVGMLGGLFALVLALSGAGDVARTITATPEFAAGPSSPSPLASAPVTPTPDPFGIGTVMRDVTGRYAFPVAADPHYYTWTHYHWDGTHAADIEARAGLTRAEFDQLTRVPLVAVAHGAVFEWSGAVGGQGYVLQGDDGLDYYYAHMVELWLADGTRVEPGTSLGLIGNTGGTAQFIEPHLHFAIGPRGSLQMQSALVINVAEWLLDTFGLGWQSREPVTPLPAQPGGSPLPYPQIVIATSYDQAVAAGLPQPAIELSYDGAALLEPLDVIATLTGEVNVIRWTEHYGTRIQIANETSRVTVVISGVDEWLVQDGQLVTRGQVIARWSPDSRPALHYMLYRDSVVSDPTPTLADFPS